MLFYTHLLLGIAFFLIVRSFYPAISTPVFLVLILLGSVLPDIDERNSRINRWSGILGGITAFFTKHRGIFHSFFLVAVLVLIIQYFWSWSSALALFLGYTAHLLGDSLTPAGVQLFYPFSQFRARGPIRTGSIWETGIMILLVVFIVWRLV